jgi:uncharacterized protein (TIGR03083 family)
MGVNPDVRRRHDAMREAAALLAEGTATAAPADVRDRLLRSVAGRPFAHAVAPSTPLQVYEHQIADLRELLDTLGPQEWDAVAAPYAWSVHALVAHLSVIERYSARQLGLEPDLDYADGEHHLSVGADEILAELERPPAATADAWHQRALTTARALRSGAVDLDAGVVFHGWPFSGSAVLIARSFEIWTHGDDVRRATGRPMTTPAPADLRAMSTYSVGSLPLLVPVVAPAVEPAPARVVLSGRGGGTFRIGGGADADPAVTIVTDVVDYCRLAARRIDIADLDVTVEGDGRLGDALLAAARVFAV